MSCDFCGGDILSKFESDDKCKHGGGTMHTVCHLEWLDRTAAGLCVCCKKPLETPHFTSRHDWCHEYDGYPPAPCG